MSLLRKALFKLALFVLWPVVAVIMLAIFTVVGISVWVAIPFARLIEKPDGKIKILLRGRE